ncbi:MAG: phosphatase PAP2 family protein [Deltaproteobacteria bacterium]|nr:phosphatase PAP2 family protein [Candidatus Zymogenaceae bacterium]
MIRHSVSRFLMLFNPAELCTWAFFLFVTLLIIVFNNNGAIRPYFIANIGILFLIVLIALVVKRRPEFRPLVHLRNWYPAFLVTVPYRELSILIPQIQPRDIDDVLIRLDYFIFHVHPTVFIERFEVPVLTDIFQLVYCSYYFLPILLGLVVYLRRDMRDFIHVVFAILFSFYVTYVGYMLFPAVGPRFSLYHLQTTALVGWVVTLPIREYLNWLEHIMRDAFPSGHTMLALVVLFYTWRYEKRLLFLFAPFAFLIIISTIYLRYHYAVDVLAGIILAVPTVVAVEVAMDWWEKTQKLYRSYPDDKLLKSL